MTARGAREVSRVYLRRLGLTVPDDLALVAEPDATGPQRTRDRADVVGRCQAIAAVLDLLDGADPSLVRERVELEDLYRWFAEDEREFFDRRTKRRLFGRANEPRPSDDHLGLRAEALWAMLWALGAADGLNPEHGHGDHRGALARLDDDADLVPRSGAELLEALDLYTCLHWNVLDAGLRDLTLRDPLDGDVIVERWEALTWLAN